MRVLLHICCAPCTIFPLKVLRGEGHDVTGSYYNPNIHPYLEYKRRLDTLRDYALREALPVRFDETYAVEEFFRGVVFAEEDRCRHCYDIRLRHVAASAIDGEYEAFTTTLLYSKYQKHELIREVGERVASEYGVLFLYRDFRVGWSEGLKISRLLGLYRQPYCGCLYSEKERYWRPQHAVT